MTDSTNNDLNNGNDPGATRQKAYDQSTPDPGFFERLSRSVSDPNWYSAVALEPWGRTIRYTAKLILLSALISYLLVLYQTFPLITKAYDNVQRQMVPVTIDNGDLNTDVDVPYRIQVIRDYEIILDPEGTLNRTTLGDNVISVFVNGGIYYRSGTGGFDFMSLRTGEGSEPVTVTGETLSNARTKMLAGIVGIQALGVLLLQLIMNGARIGLVALGGWFLTRGLDQPPAFQQLTQLSCYILTGIIGIDLLLSIVGIPIHSLGSFYEIGLLLIGSFFLQHLQQRIPRQPTNEDGSTDTFA